MLFFAHLSPLICHLSSVLRTHFVPLRQGDEERSDGGGGQNQSPLATTNYLSTPSPLRGTHPCLRGRKWLLGYCRNIMNIFTQRQQTVPLGQGRRANRRGWIRKHSPFPPLTSHLSPFTSHLSPLTSHLSPLTLHLSSDCFSLMSKANNSVICTL